MAADSLPDARTSIIAPAVGVAAFTVIVVGGDRSVVAVTFLVLLSAFLVSAVATVVLYRRHPELERLGSPSSTRMVTGRAGRRARRRSEEAGR
ncbi:hypothetical protein [Nakamurella leprariae]|uniref:Uncharacterized protein n=1 Tax=Nakamurella leprariae TaxID=2803911 RepID=A0A939C3B8_9ACTN|nr:hypothetical protein [Nakamurella leprariae]MBM9468942.1 hypothetical protein [Nakamurella leprariae]